MKYVSIDLPHQVTFDEAIPISVTKEEIRYERSTDDCVEIYFSGFPAPTSCQGKKVIIVAGHRFKGWPKENVVFNNSYRTTRQGEAVVAYALREFGHLIPENILFKTSLLGQLIKERTKGERNMAIADVCLMNSEYLSPFVIKGNIAYQPNNV